MTFKMSTYFSVRQCFHANTIMLHLLLNSIFWWKDGAKCAPLKARAHKWSCDERLSRSLIKKDETQHLFSVKDTKLFVVSTSQTYVWDPTGLCLILRKHACWQGDSVSTRATYWLWRADSPAWRRQGRWQKRPPALSARLWSGLQTPWCWTPAPRLGPAWWPPSQSSDRALETDLRGDRRMADILTL